MIKTTYKDLLVNMGGKNQDLNLSVLIEFKNNGDGNCANVKMFDLKTKDGRESFKKAILKIEEFDEFDFSEQSIKEIFTFLSWHHGQGIAIGIEKNNMTGKKCIVVNGEGEKEPSITGQTIFEIPQKDNINIHSTFEFVAGVGI